MLFHFFCFLFLSFIVNLVFNLTTEKSPKVIWAKTLRSTFNFVGALISIGIVMFLLN
jgi:hypothetical protein